MNLLIESLKAGDFAKKRNLVQEQFSHFVQNTLNNDSALLSQKSLLKLFLLYDQIFFDLFFSKNTKISLAISRRLTRSAGITSFSRKTGEIKISFSIPLLLHAFKITEKGYCVNGIHCQHGWQALMRVMEHELIHAVEFVLKGNSSCTGHDFKVLVRRLFDHTDTKHQIQLSYSEMDGHADLSPGDKVSFEYQDQIFHGIINRITRRATVLVPNHKGLYADAQGNRYAKYYVPIKLLKKTGV